MPPLRTLTKHWFDLFTSNWVDKLEKAREEAVIFWTVVASTLIVLADIETTTGDHVNSLYLLPVTVVALRCQKVSVAWLLALAILAGRLVDIVTETELNLGRLYEQAVIAIFDNLLTIYACRLFREQYMRAHHQASTDPLTGLANRRSFMRALEVAIVWQQRYGGMLALAILDLDKFKQLNDSQGHGSGDVALKKVAALLQKKLRTTDTAARIGGDEFAILINQAKLHDCQNILNNLCHDIQAAMADMQFPVTASIGCIHFETAPDNAIHVLQQADEVMYQVKGAGKNNALVIAAPQ